MKFENNEECRFKDGELHTLVASLPHYHLVEKDPEKHEAWRANLLKPAETDAAYRKKLMKMCKEDVLFFINAFCIAQGTLVVTDRGAVPIEDVTIEDRVWDGTVWVKHDGLFCSGEKEVIDAYGIRLTPEHKVMTNHGWKIASERHDRKKVRLPRGHKGVHSGREKGVLGVPVRLRRKVSRAGRSSTSRRDDKLRVPKRRGFGSPHARDVKPPHVFGMERDEDAVQQERKRKGAPSVRRSGHSCLREVGEVRELLRRHGRLSTGEDARPDRQRRRLHARKLPLGHTKRTGKQHKYQRTDSNIERYAHNRASVTNSRSLPLGDKCTHQERASGRRRLSAQHATKEIVYDILNCGPKKAFTVIDRTGEPVLVHNCHLWEPREGEAISGIAPFLTWEHQDPVIAASAFYLGRRNMVGHKSRAQGASWYAVALFVWRFIFYPNTMLGFGSKDLDTADSSDNPESLGWKIDFTIEKLPWWMRPTIDRKFSTHTWHNKDNASYIKGYAATSKIGRAGRFYAFLLDESAFFPGSSDREAVANLVETTNCVLMISTPNGMDNEHYDRIHKPGTWLRLVLHWMDNPYQRVGMYTTANGNFVSLDEDYQYDDDFVPITDGRVRSPWYDRKCEDHGHDMLYIGQELDIEYSGSKGRPFPQAALDRCMEFTKPPLHTGMLLYEEGFPENVEEMTWVEGPGYKFDLWVPLDSKSCPPEGRYVIGCDISAGVGGDMSSNSTAIVFNAATREQVGELATNIIPPVDFAYLVVAMAYWFGRGRQTTYLAWEKQGPGVPFTNEILKMGYTNVFYQPVSDALRRYSKRSDKPGYHNSDRMIMLTPLISAVSTGSCTFRSSALLEECGHYQFMSDGKPDHPRRKTARDGSGKGESHGDRAIGATMVVRAMDDRPDAKHTDVLQEMKDRAPENSMGGRVIKRLKQKNQDLRAWCKW